MAGRKGDPTAQYSLGVFSEIAGDLRKPPYGLARLQSRGTLEPQAAWVICLGQGRVCPKTFPSRTGGRSRAHDRGRMHEDWWSSPEAVVVRARWRGPRWIPIA